jgi:hypothetical protein
VKIRFKGLFIIVLIGALIGSVTALAVDSIWSNTLPHQFTNQPWPPGTITLSFPSASSNIGQSITLTATLNPLPTQYQLQQNVVFYYSSLENTDSSTPITDNPATGLALVGGKDNPALSSVLTINGVATLTFTPQVTGTFYFIAEIPLPT